MKRFFLSFIITMLMLACISKAYVCDQNTPNLLAYYEFDDNQAVVVDSAGCDHNGTREDSPTFSTDCPLGTCYTFNNNGNIIIPSSLSGYTEFTAEAWIQPSAVPSSGDIDQIMAVESSYVIGIGYSGGAKIRVDINDGSWCALPVWSSTVIDVGKQYHVAVKWDTTTDMISIYLNGTLDNAGSCAKSTLLSATTGYLATSISNLNFSGKIDDVRIWNVSRTDAEIHDYYNKELNFSSGAPPSGSLDILSPDNTTYSNVSLPLYITNSSFSLVSAKYSLNGGANITFTNGTYINSAEGFNYITVWANSTTGSWYSDTEYFTVRYWNITSQIYDSILYSPMTTVYSISMSITNETAISSLNASLIINDTDYSYDYYSVAGTTYSFYKEIGVNETADFQYIFNWNVTIVSGTGTSYDTTDEITQYGYIIRITNCTYEGAPSETFQLKSELTGTSLTGDLQVIFTAWAVSGSSVVYSFNATGASSYTFCIVPNVSSYQANIQLTYNTTDYRDRTMYLYNVTMDNTTDTTVLYLLPTTMGSTIKIHVVDKDNNDVSGAVVKVQRYMYGVAPYAGWQDVQSFLTDGDGEGSAFIILNTVTYRYVVEENGEEVYSEDKNVLYDGTVLQTLVLSIAETNIEWSQLNAGFHPYCTYNNESYIERCYISDTSGLVTSTTMLVDKMEPLGKTNICSQTSSLSTITMQCSLGSSPSGIYKIMLKVTVRSGNLYTYVFDPITISTEPLYGDNGIFIQILLIMGLMLVGAWNGGFALILGAGSLLIGSAIGVNVLTLPSIVGIIIVAMIILYKVR